jgi:hypothetical protein
MRHAICGLIAWGLFVSGVLAAAEKQKMPPHIKKYLAKCKDYQKASFALPSFDLAVGQTGTLPESTPATFNHPTRRVPNYHARCLYKVVQVLDANNMLLGIYEPTTGAPKLKGTVWLSGYSTKGLVTDKYLKFADTVFHVAATKTYRTVGGGSRTVFLLKTIDLDKWRTKQ